MTTSLITLQQMDTMYKVEQDWLFEKLLGKLNSHRHLILASKQDWGLQEYVKELGFQLAEKHPDIHVCYMDMKPAHSSGSFLEMFMATLYHRFPEAMPHMDPDSNNMEILELPTLIAQRKKIRIALFLGNSHLFHRFRDLVHYPGPLSGLGQFIELRHNPLKHRSASVRRFFHDQDKDIGYNTSVQMSFMVDNHPFYLKLLAWHALIRTHHTCTLAIIENAMNDLIRHFEHHFYKIAENLTPKQLSFLKALIEGNQKLYSKATRNEYQLGSTSNISRIKQSLEKREIIGTESMDIFFIDPIFREWLRKRYFSRK